MTNRAEHITCIKQAYATDISWCGENIKMVFAFQNIDHARGAVKNGSRLTVCPGCWEAWNKKLEDALRRNLTSQFS